MQRSIIYHTDVDKTSVDVHELSYGRPSVSKLTSISFYKDVHKYCYMPGVTRKELGNQIIIARKVSNKHFQNLTMH